MYEGVNVKSSSCLCISDDDLTCDLQHNRAAFEAQARKQTQEHAMQRSGRYGAQPTDTDDDSLAHRNGKGCKRQRLE